jgi:hypothetical protein
MRIVTIIPTELERPVMRCAPCEPFNFDLAVERTDSRFTGEFDSSDCKYYAGTTVFSTWEVKYAARPN